jgi:hypothetical protein
MISAYTLMYKEIAISCARSRYSHRSIRDRHPERTQRIAELRDPLGVIHDRPQADVHSHGRHDLDTMPL